MRNWKQLFLVFVVLASMVQGEEFDLYLLAGQSNMDGRGKIENLSEVQKELSEDAIIFYRNLPHKSDGWQRLGPGYSIAPKYKGGLPSKTFGPELGFVAALTKAQPGKKIALIKGSKGGTNLRSDWKPGEKGKPETQGPRYQDFIETIRLAQEALKKDGHTGTLKALLWHQGESDAKVATAKHQARLIELIARIREDMGEEKLPIVLGQVFDNGKRDKVRKAISKASKADPLVALVSSKGMTTWDPGTHFDAKSQLLLGERFAVEVQKLLKLSAE